MNGQQWFVLVSSVVNLVLFVFAIIFAATGMRVAFIVIFFPLFVAAITFIIVRVVRKYEALRTIKYVNIAYFVSYIIPAGIFLVIQAFFTPRAIALYGVQIDPIYEQCRQTCVEVANTTQEKIMQCIDYCRR